MNKNVKPKEKVGITDMAEFLSMEFGIDRQLSKRIVTALVTYMIKSILRGQILNLRNFLTVSRYLYTSRIKSGLGRLYDVPDTFKIKVVVADGMKKELSDLQTEKAVIQKMNLYNPKEEEDIDVNFDLLKNIRL